MHSTLSLLASFQLAVTVLLAVIVPFISATPSPSQVEPPRRGLHFRDPVVQQRDVLPQEWSSVGCYTDDPTQRTLTSRWNRDSTSMTVENCIMFCNSRKTIYAGVENGEDCYCGNVTTVGSTLRPPSDCNSICVGDVSEMCGGSNSLNLYRSGAAPPPQPTLVEFARSPGWWARVGCFSDSNDARILSVRTLVQGGPEMNSVESCTGACEAAGYHLAGVELANECWCDNVINNWHPSDGNKTGIDTGHCVLACSGDSSEICGGANSLLVYFNDGIS